MKEAILMSMCRICGDENANYNDSLKQIICSRCAEGTPMKITRQEFDERYWDSSDEVPKSVKREFYEDYLSSVYAFDMYKQLTSEPIY